MESFYITKDVADSGNIYPLPELLPLFMTTITQYSDAVISLSQKVF